VIKTSILTKIYFFICGLGIDVLYCKIVYKENLLDSCNLKVNKKRLREKMQNQKKVIFNLFMLKNNERRFKS
jgi:hypothetical protein